VAGAAGQAGGDPGRPRAGSQPGSRARPPSVLPGRPGGRRRHPAGPPGPGPFELPGSPSRLSDQGRFPAAGCGVRFRGPAGGRLPAGPGGPGREPRHQGRLARLERVGVTRARAEPGDHGPWPAKVADRCAGTLADVLRLANSPPRQRPHRVGPPCPPVGRGRRSPAAAARPGPGPWARYPDGPVFLDALASRRGTNAPCGSALPGPQLARGDRPGGGQRRGRPGGGALARGPRRPPISACSIRPLTAQLGPGRHVTLSGGPSGPPERYRRWLAVRRGGQAGWWPATRRRHVRAGQGPGAGGPLGMTANDLHAEAPRARTRTAREVLAAAGAPHRRGRSLIGGLSPGTAEVHQPGGQWLGRGPSWRTGRWSREHASPRVRAAGGDAETRPGTRPRPDRPAAPGLVLRTAREAPRRRPRPGSRCRAAATLPPWAVRGCRERARWRGPAGGPALAPGRRRAWRPVAGWWRGRRTSMWRCSRCGHSIVPGPG